MEDVRGVQGLEGPEGLANEGGYQNPATRSKGRNSPHLVNKVLAMIVTKFLGSDDAMEVSFH
jgi:hypothetical protein